jgi:hypothetical protein
MSCAGTTDATSVYTCGSTTNTEGTGCDAGYFRTRTQVTGTAAAADKADKCEECTLVGCKKCDLDKA